MTSSQLAGEWIFYDRSQHGVGHDDEAAFASSLELVGQYAEGIGVAFEVSNILPKPGETSSFTAFPAPSLKKVCMAFSPEWPKGGLPKSCAVQAALTIVPISSKRVSFSSGRFSMIRFEMSLPNDIPTLDTSRLWVSRLCTKIEPEQGENLSLVLQSSESRREDEPVVVAFELRPVVVALRHAYAPVRNAC